MTTASQGGYDLPEPDALRARYAPEGTFRPEHRSADQLAVDAEAAALQSAALTDQGLAPHSSIDEILMDAVRRHAYPPEGSGATRFDILGLPGLDGAGGARVLTTPDELCVGVPDSPDGEEHARCRDEVVEAGGEVYAVEPSDCPALDLFHRRLVHGRLRTGGDLRAVPGAELTRAVGRLRRGGRATSPNYVATLGHVIKTDDFPRQTTPRPYEEANPTGVKVAVLDTGIQCEEHGDGWLDRVSRDPQADPVRGNIDLLDVLPGDGLLDLGAGHGTFVAGIVEQMAPGVEILMYRATDTDGFGTEASIARLMVRAACDGANIIHLSLGLSTADDLPPAAMQLAVELISDLFPDVLIVASAGNMGDQRPMWPAAFKEVVAVGAVDGCGNPATWSNHGFWVDCSAVGVGVASTFPAGVESGGKRGPIEFGPGAWAVWSGTSFSAPQISGLVAQLMADYPGRTPRALLRHYLRGTPRLPGFGHVVTLLPGS